MSPNLYDLLDVEEGADAAEIRAAWKSAIADLDPTDRRFRAYNDAAGVLLDPDKRAAYDAELAEARAEEEPADEVDEVDEVDTAVPVATDGTDADDDAVLDDDDEHGSEDDATADARGRTRRPRRTGRAGATAVALDDDDTDDRAPRSGPPGWALGAAAVAALLSLALAVWILTMPGVRADASDSPAAVAERGAVQDRAALEAEAAAEKLVGPVLSYNHKTMAEDLERIRGNMTEKMGEKQAASWPDITKEAEAQQIVVEATPAGTALTRVSPKGDRATVVAFVDQYVEKQGAQPFVLRMWATMSLVKASGSEGRWLLDDICTDDTCG